MAAPGCGVYRAQRPCAWRCPEKAGCLCPGWSISPGPIGAGRNVLCVWCWAPQFPQLLGGGRVSTDSEAGVHSPGSQWSAQIWGIQSLLFPLTSPASPGPEVLSRLLGNLVTKSRGPVCDDAEAAVPTVQLLGEGTRRAGTVLWLLDPPAPRLPWLDGGGCLSADSDGSPAVLQTPMLQSLLGYLAMDGQRALLLVQVRDP